MDSTKSSSISELKKSQEQSSRIGWIDKHAELISKLEAQYQQPQKAHDESLVTRYYTFSIAEYNLLIPGHVTSEILEENNIYPITLAPDWLIGACNVRGEIVPIIDIFKILKLKSKDINLDDNKILILGKEENYVGMLIENLPVAMQFKKDDSINEYSKISDHLKPFITAAYVKNEKMWLSLDFIPLIESIAD